MGLDEKNAEYRLGRRTQTRRFSVAQFRRGGLRCASRKLSNGGRNRHRGPIARLLQVSHRDRLPRRYIAARGALGDRLKCCARKLRIHHRALRTAVLLHRSCIFLQACRIGGQAACQKNQGKNDGDNLEPAGHLENPERQLLMRLYGASRHYLSPR